MSKTCTKCGETKPLDGFYRDKGKADGRSPHCKECERERYRCYYEENRDKRREYFRRYREENLDERLEYERRYREENSDKKREYVRRYYKENRDKERARKRIYYEENRDKERERHHRYHEENRNKVLDSKRRYREENRDILNQGKKSRYAQYTRTSNLLTSKKGVPYSPEEDALILADNGMTTYQKAIELGRTYQSVGSRKRRLRALANH